MIFIFCPNCGEEIDDESKFCKHCGNSISSTNDKIIEPEVAEVAENNEDTETGITNTNDTQRQRRSFNTKQNTKKEDTQTAEPKKTSPWKIIGGCCLGLILLVVIVGIISPDHKSTNYNTNDTPDTNDTNTTYDTKDADDSKDTDNGLTEEEFKANCSKLDYKQYMKNPSKFTLNNLKVSGRVLQIQEDSDGGAILLYQDDDVSKTIYITYDGTNNVVEDDYITVYGTAYDTYSYTSQANYHLTCPWVNAKYIDKKKN